MFRHNYGIFSCVYLFLYVTRSCISEPLYPPQLVLYSPGDPEYTDVVVKRVGDKLTLVCELKDDNRLNTYVWNYMPDNVTADRSYTLDPPESSTPTQSSTLVLEDLQLSHSGRFMCSAPPFSLTKYILVQTRGPIQCARGAFWCGSRCVLAAYVCDGFSDCRFSEDEDPALCSPHVCTRNDKLNCSSGRCISAAACCRRGGGGGGGAGALCRQPTCCDEYGPLLASSPLDDLPATYDDRRAPDDYGFIQSTIYTVTACALIFMLAVVLLVSAICKMHMKRAALRQYSQPEHYVSHPSHRFPPCYEASRLLEGVPPSPVHSPPSPPLSPRSPPSSLPLTLPLPTLHRGRGLARLSSIFSTRYRQVPSRPMEVEMTSVVSRYRLAEPPSPPAGGGPPGGGERPDTPTVSGADLDFLDTYTLNGRTIRLLGADFPPTPTFRPPPYKMSIYGPPPHYLSRDSLPATSPAPDDVELPPRYDELGSQGNAYAGGNNNGGDGTNTGTNTGSTGNANGSNGTSLSSNGFPNGNNATGRNDNNTSNGIEITVIMGSNAIIPPSTGTVTNDTISVSVVNGNSPPIVTDVTDNDTNGNVTSSNNDVVESLSSVIDNLPAIDSDVNANDSNDVTCDA